nr:hypothetical protein [Candidatus Arsenophonus triatominarum]
MDARWSVEVYHREVNKQNCGIKRCQARTRAERKEIIFFSLFLRGLNNINVVYLKK